MILPKKAYEIIRWIVSCVIPELIVFYGTIGSALNIPYTKTVLIIIGAIGTLLGGIFLADKVVYDKKQNAMNGYLGDGKGDYEEDENAE